MTFDVVLTELVILCHLI